MELFKNSAQNPALPKPGNTGQMRLYRERWQELNIPVPDKAWPLLDCVFGNSPYLATALLKEAEFFQSLREQGFEACFEALLRDLPQHPQLMEGRDELCTALRIGKRRASLLIALADITGTWELEKITAALSRFAELCIRLTVRHLLRAGATRGEIALPFATEPEQGSGLIVLAMGKLGAGELNYSSDIDLIVFFDADRTAYTGRATASHFFVKLAHDLTAILSDRTRDGYVFRVDLRLRPDPGSTPAAVSLKAAEIYYETLGQNWERAAMIKARPVAGDPESCRKFMDIITPYVWRRSLDFASIQDIHSIKRQIDSRIGQLPPDLHGHNIKLGRGGIREIEFFVQTQQLIWGGRLPGLRVSGTCDALRALAATQHLRQEICDELIAAYRFYRTVEHRLQMVDDQQTHALPDTPEKMREFATFLGYRSTDAFITKLTNALTTVQAHYSRLFEHSPSLASGLTNAPGNLVFTGTENDPATLETLERMGFSTTPFISETIRGWHHGRYRATRTRRARELLTELVPVMLAAFAKTANSDIAFARFDDFLRGLPAGVQIFSLFYANPKLLNLIADIMGGYPYIAANLGRSPHLLDYVLTPEFYDTLPDTAALHAELKESLKKSVHLLEDALNIIRNWSNDRQFRIGIQLIRRQITPEEAAAHLSNIADVVLHNALYYVQKDFSRNHGSIAGSQFAVIAFGKLGGRELTFGSDLDLVFIYDAPDKDALSGGDTALGCNQYFTRLSRRFINALTALTPEGKLYDIDLRLRPSGNDGPVASSLKAFELYYDDAAWAWEYMALTRARAVAGKEPFRKRVAAAIRDKLRREWDVGKLRWKLLDIHGRTAREFGTRNPFSIKYVPGGLLDLEYIVQFLQLLHVGKHPETLDTNTSRAIAELAKTGLLEAGAAAVLEDAATLYSNLLCILRLMERKDPDPAAMTEGMKKTLTYHLGAPDFETLRATLEAAQKNVQNLFRRIIVASSPL